MYHHRLHGKASISIHAPAWGATRISALTASRPEFQFTPPRGGRLPLLRMTCAAPRFQFTPPRGGRPNARRSFGPPASFQFTPPRGGRQQKRTKSCCNDCAFCCISRLVSRESKGRGSFLFGLCSESPSKRCANLPRKCVRRQSARQRFTEAAAHRFRSVRCVR